MTAEVTNGWRWIMQPASETCGWLELTAGRGVDIYHVKLTDSDWATVTYELRKELVKVDGSATYAAPYIVTLPAPGVSGKATCTCKGFEYSRRMIRSCRHTLVLSEALDAIDNTTAKVAA